jgi:selenocysteine-specific elongation factor
MILGTAGHIDHGKTTLVRALTGVDTDRLPEEKRRGITIDLGFAPLELDGIGTVGVVDVPGHEAFVRTMVAGATGVDLALLVVAADEGMMPQTREHLAVLDLLGVTRGVIALTKSDLVEPDWLALVREDVLEALAGSSLGDAVVVPVSATTGSGLDALRAALAHIAREVPPRGSDDLFRLPVDRVFTIRGTGTVVTGTVWSGALARDAVVRLMPGDHAVRVRGVQAHGHPVETVHAGDRAAIALSGIDLDQVHRGSTLVVGESWRPTRLLRADVALLLDAPRPLGPRARVRLHLGTQDVAARVVVRHGSLGPGDERAARVVLDTPIVARAGDRFVLRAESPPCTIGGGVVTDPLAPARARPWPTPGLSVAERLSLLLTEVGASGLAVADLPVRLGVVPAAVSSLLHAGDLWRVGDRIIAEPVRAALATEALAALDAYHADRSLEPGVPIQWLRSRLGAPDEVTAAVVARLAQANELVVEQGLLRRPAFAPRLSTRQAALREALLVRLVAAGNEPPTVDELAVSLSSTPAELLPLAHLLAREGTLVAVEPTRFYRADSVADLCGRLRIGMAPGQRYGPGDLREMLGFSRKFLIPFLEYCDRVGETMRDSSGRVHSGVPTATGR